MCIIRHGFWNTINYTELHSNYNIAQTVYFVFFVSNEELFVNAFQKAK